MKKYLLFITVLNFIIVWQSAAQTLKFTSSKLIGSANGVGYANCLTKDSKGNIYLAGNFTNVLDFDPGAGLAYLPAENSEDIYIVKYDSLGRYIWAKDLTGNTSEKISSIAADSTGDIYVIGTFSGKVDFDPSAATAFLNATQATMFIAKYSSSGNYLWAECTTGAYAQGNSITINQANNLCVTGTFKGKVDFDPSAGIASITSSSLNWDMFIAEYTSAGAFNWVKDIQAGLYGICEVESMKLDQKGNIYLGGTFSDTIDFDPSLKAAKLSSGGYRDAFIAKYDSSGNYIWAKSTQGMAGSLSQVSSVAVDASQNVYVAGYFDSIVDFDPSAVIRKLHSFGNDDIFIAKYDSLGSYVWAKQMGGNASFGDRAQAIGLDTNCNVYVTGYFSGTADFDPSATVKSLVCNFADPFLAKYDSSGKYTWALHMGDSTQYGGTSLVIDSKGNVNVAGDFHGKGSFDPLGVAPPLSTTPLSSDLFFLSSYKLSGAYSWAIIPDGTPLGNDFGNCIKVDEAGNYYVTGSFTCMANFDKSGSFTWLGSAGGSDAFLAKYTTGGKCVWGMNLGGPLDDRGNSIALDSTGNIYITGNFSGTADFDPSAATYNLTSAGGTDIFIAKYNSSGNFIWAISMGGPLDDSSASITVDKSGNSYITGSYEGTADFDPSASTFFQTSYGITDLFIAKYNPFGHFIWAQGKGNNDFDMGNAIALDANANVYVTGSFSGTVQFDKTYLSNTLSSHDPTLSDLFIAKYDSSGTYKWAHSAGGLDADAGTSLVVDGKSNVFVTGWNAFDYISGSQIYIAEYNQSGVNVWTNVLLATGGSGMGLGIALDAGDNVFVSGLLQNQNTDFDPSANVAKLGTGSSFIANYDASGKYLQGISQPAYLNSIVIDHSNNIYLTGYTNFATHSPTAHNDIIIESYKSSPVGIEFINDTRESLLTVYPNPNNGSFTIKTQKDVIIKIINGLGQLIDQVKLDGANNWEYSTGGFSSGIYFVVPVSAEMYQSLKVVVTR